MAIKLFPESPNTPAAALAKLKKEIDDQKATTWSYSGNNFHYQPTQWKGAIKFVAETEDDHLYFGAQSGAGNPGMSYDDAYPYLHGRLLELLMGHAGKYKRISAHDNRKKK